MLTRTGKYSFVINFILSIILVYGEVSGSISAGTPAFAVASLSFVLHVIACIPAFVAALILRKKPIKEGLTANTFKLYFFIATATTTLLSLFGLSLLGEEYDSGFATEFALLFPLYIVMANLIISALVVNILSIWKNSIFASIIMGAITAMLLLSFIPIYMFIDDSSKKKFYGDPDVLAVQIESEYYEEEEEYYDDYEVEEDLNEGSVPPEFIGVEKDVENAAKYFYSKMNYINESYNTPYENLHQWSYDTREQKDGFKFDSAYFHSENLPYPTNVLPATRKEFEQAQKSFYKLYDSYNVGKNSLFKIYELYYSNFFNVIQTDIYISKGLHNLVEYALLSHSDIYSKDGHEDVLKDIYKMMNNPGEELPIDENGSHVGGWGTSGYYPHIKKYMSPDVLAQIGIDDDNAESLAVAVWAYSFWARRYHEGTDKSVYRILTHIRSYHQ